MLIEGVRGGGRRSSEGTTPFMVVHPTSNSNSNRIGRNDHLFLPGPRLSAAISRAESPRFRDARSAHTHRSKGHRSTNHGESKYKRHAIVVSVIPPGHTPQKIPDPQPEGKETARSPPASTTTVASAINTKRRYHSRRNTHANARAWAQAKRACFVFPAR